MRLKVRRLWRAIKRELPIQFGHEQLTSYGGLELVRRYFQLIGLNARIRCALGKHVGGDYGCSHLVLLVIGLLVVGARRLQHLRYLANDSLFARFCGSVSYPQRPHGGQLAQAVYADFAARADAPQQRTAL